MRIASTILFILNKDPLHNSLSRELLGFKLGCLRDTERGLGRVSRLSSLGKDNDVLLETLKTLNGRPNSKESCKMRSVSD